MVFEAGVTAKLAPLALLPMAVPPEGTVNQLMVLPADVAFSCEVPPGQIAAGVAVTGLGAGITGQLITFMVPVAVMTPHPPVKVTV